MLGSSGSLLVYIVCKCIGAVGIGHLQSAAPTFGVECCPPRRRGVLVTLYSAGSGLGSFVVALVCFGTSKIHNDWSWKLPVICQIPIAAIYGCGIFFFPESPRWLLTKGREEEARQSFSRLYDRPIDSPEITADILQITEAIERESTLTSNTSWLEMFHGLFLRRTLTAFAIIVGSPICGTFFVFTYAAVFLTEVGVSTPVTVVVILNTCCFAGSIIGPFVVEYLGRRRTMLTGYAMAAVCMLIFAVVSSATGETSQATKATVTAFICIWAFVFSGFIASTMWIASAEMHSLRHRTYAQALSAALSNVFTFAANFWTPYMINPEYGDMGLNVGYFYFGLEVIIFVVLFLVVPETGRISLEQIDAYFTSGVKPWKTSLAKNKKLS
ncbi:general substrate transporter [Aspergillus keveii]|uniref:General substrate transporter n=1 Tax=Aspergillus keveii TaxID=714993 RepID=A0ABR4FIX1_9EURO